MTSPKPQLIFDMEVDVALRRPPTPANTRTWFSRIAVADRQSLTGAETEARTLAALMAHRHGPMVTAVRVVSAEI